MPYMAVFVILLTIGLWVLLKKQWQQAGAQGWVVRQDLDGMGNQVYKDKKNGIVCKPDVVERRRIIEYKSAVTGSRARPGDILQLASQMMSTGAMEAELRYHPDRRFVFRKDSPEIRSAMNTVVQTLNRMRKHLRSKNMPKGTPSPGRCRICQFRWECPESVAKHQA